MSPSLMAGVNFIERPLTRESKSAAIIKVRDSASTSDQYRTSASLNESARDRLTSGNLANNRDVYHARATGSPTNDFDAEILRVST